MTDLPADLRQPLVDALLPTLITPVHEMQTDKRHHAQDACGGCTMARWSSRC